MHACATVAALYALFGVLAGRFLSFVGIAIVFAVLALDMLSRAGAFDRVLMFVVGVAASNIGFFIGSLLMAERDCRA